MTYKFNSLDDGSGNCVGTVISFETVTVLVDPGWSSKKVSYDECVRFWSNIIPEVDIILLSQSTIDSLGAYGLLYYNFLSHFVSRIQVYATLPITNLGRVSTIDLYVARGILGPYTSNKLDLEDIENAFDHINALKFSQILDLRSRFDGLSIVAYNSGYAPGGSIWSVSNYSEKLLYARRWHHTKSTILNAASILDSTGMPISALFRPSGIITTLDRFGSSKPLKKRARVFKDTLRQALNSNGTVIIPCEVGGKFLDLLVLVHDYLYEHSRNGKYPNIPILLVSYSKGRTLTYARSMLEWLSSSVIKTWESRDSKSPFDLDNLLKVVAPEDVSKYSGSKICFVSQVEQCFTDTIKKLDPTTRSTLILTSNEENDIDILLKLQNRWDQNINDKTIEEGRTLSYTDTLDVKTVALEPLKCKKLQQFNDKIDERRKERKEFEVSLRKEAKQANKFSHAFSANNENSSSMGDNSERDLLGSNEMEDSESDDDDDDEDSNLLNILKGNSRGLKKSHKHDIPVDVQITTDSLLKHKMFQFDPKREKRDDYGTLTDFSQFIPKDDETEDVIDISKKRALSDSGNKKTSLSDSVNQVKRLRSAMNSEKDKNDELKKQQQNFDNIEYLDVKNHPAKRSEIESTITIHCEFTFINLENIVDQRSTTAILPSLKPRKIILLGRQEIQNKNIISVLEKRDIELVEIPFNEDIEFDTTVKTLDISIDSTLDQLLKWQRIGDGHTVAHVIGRLVKEASTSQKSTSNRSKLILKPLTSTAKLQTSGSLSIGDVRLAELRRKLTDMNYDAKFKGEGTLVINGEVAVRKINDGETIIDGSPSEVFDAVKNAVTTMLAKI